MTADLHHAGASLLESLQRIIERTYRMETGVLEIGRFVIGDEGYRRFYAGRPLALLPEPSPVVAGSAGGGAKVLVHDGSPHVGALIYYPDDLIAALEAHPPTRGLGDENVDAFATFVEELDHFLLIAERARYGRPVSLLELELHAGVTKYLVCALFLSRASRGPDRRALREDDPSGSRGRLWLRWHLFEKIAYAETDPAVLDRYRDAARFARRFLDRLEEEPCASSRLERLRAFHDATHQQKLAALLS